MIDATGESDVTLLLHEGEEFGSLSCLTGTRHTATAITQSASDVWGLRRSDLIALLSREPEIRRGLAEFLDSAGVPSTT